MSILFDTFIEHRLLHTPAPFKCCYASAQQAHPNQVLPWSRSLNDMNSQHLQLTGICEGMNSYDRDGQ